jgi:hypothetical protein
LIAILKYIDDGNGGMFGINDVRLLKDKILIPYMPKTDFPFMDLTTDADNGDINKRRVSEFAVRFSIRQTTLSANGDSIYNFLRDTSLSYNYMFAMKVDETFFTGTFQPHKITSLLNYHKEGEYNTGFMVRALEEDFITYLTSLGTDFPSIEFPTFEAYMHQYHLAEFDVEVPSELFWSKVGAQVYFNGRAYRNATQAGYTNWGKVNRWETFQGLYRGLGFDFKIDLNTTIEDFYNKASMTDPNESLLPRQQVKVKLFWQSDIIDSEPITLPVAKSHGENILPRKTKKAILLRTMQQVLDNDHIDTTTLTHSGEFTVVKGILMTGAGNVLANGVESFTGSSNKWVFHFPFFALSNDLIVEPNNVPEEDYLLYINSRNGLLVIYEPFDFSSNGYLLNEVYTIEMASYSFPNNAFTNNGAGNYQNKAGQLFYWRLFTKLDGTNDEVAEFAISNYRRYLSSGNKLGKVLTAKMADVEGIDVYKKIIVQDIDGDSEHYVSRIPKFDYIGRDVDFETIQL